MANHKSAKKRARQSIKKNDCNRSYSSMVKTAVKSFRTAVQEIRNGQGDVAKAETLMTKAQSALNKAATKGLVHRNNASRSVSRLVKELRVAVGGEKK